MTLPIVTRGLDPRVHGAEEPLLLGLDPRIESGGDGFRETTPFRAGLTRRAVLTGAAVGLAGCGFHPLYGPLAKGGTITPELASIYVAVMLERSGQLLRQALQQRLEGAGSGVAKQYELTGGLSVSAEALGIQQDTSSTRVRMNGAAGWSLRKLDLKQTVLTSGTARATDGYNVNNQQYFAADLEQSAAVRRIADTVADQITLEIAAYFRKQADAAA